MAAPSQTLPRAGAWGNRVSPHPSPRVYVHVSITNACIALIMPAVEMRGARRPVNRRLRLRRGRGTREGYGATRFPHIPARRIWAGAAPEGMRAACAQPRPRGSSPVGSTFRHTTSTPLTPRRIVGMLPLPRASKRHGPGRAGLRPASASGGETRLPPSQPPPAGGRRPVPSPSGEEPGSLPQRGRVREGAVCVGGLCSPRPSRRVRGRGNLVSPDPCVRAAPAQALPRAGAWRNQGSPYPCLRARPSHRVSGRGNLVSPDPCLRARPSHGRGDGGTRFPHGHMRRSCAGRTTPR